jgi:hypothetical protein
VVVQSDNVTEPYPHPPPPCHGASYIAVLPPLTPAHPSAELWLPAAKGSESGSIGFGRARSGGGGGGGGGGSMAEESSYSDGSGGEYSYSDDEAVTAALSHAGTSPRACSRSGPPAAVGDPGGPP